MTAELLELGIKPVGPDAPSGVSARDEADFAALQAEIRKLEAADRPAVNWDLVVRNGTAILSGRSKDVLVAAYLTVGLLERRGFEGLADGLTVLRDVLTNFWETLYPEVKRARGRLAAFEWLSERGGAAVVRLGERPVKAAVVETCQERVQQISDFIADKLDGGGGALFDLRSALNGVNLEGSAPAPAPAASAGSASAASAPASAAVGSVTDDASAEQAMNEAKRMMRMAGEHFRTKDAKDPIGYRLPRLAAWLSLRQAPPAADGGKTQIPPPQPADLLQRLEGMLANAQFPGVLQEVEGRVGSAVLWLDLHRLSAQALDRMGPDHAAASAAIAAEVRALLLRLPTLPGLRFANDQPLATADTQSWIRDVVMAGSEAGAGATPAPRAAAGEDGDAFQKVRDEALQLARQKKLPEALGMLSDEARRSPRLRDRVRLELEGARILLEQGHHEAALAQLEGLDAEVRGGAIEAWDPDVAGEVLRSLIACRQRLGAKTPEEAQRVRDLLQRLSRFDVVATLELSAKR